MHFRIVTRTRRTIQTGIVSLNSAVHKLKQLEYDLQRAGIYNPGYYQIEGYEEPPVHGEPH